MEEERAGIDLPTDPNRIRDYLRYLGEPWKLFGETV